ncbi:ABC transporter ATP-binding protein [Nocardia macrotermitis]|uniref:Sulfate/thiosulfate import ATP-binding protein CysA n=1 Tax=Nocardia macrotermitis TaxID=2585198 RepID=A0A7K0D6Z6_9NOCA|nr:ABC transporter ATP-binding protein [Nocardia macrotermitis]MQY21523.1 Sulfate/thiosulfate import ATP-binding protein CysA [Nocardia macrotermitis]
MTTTAAPRLEARGVTVRFGGLVALNDVDLVVPAAGIVGLVGPNGAGKSTLFAVLSGLLRPQVGAVFLDGREVTRSSPQARARRGLARTFQQPELFSGLTVRDHVVLADRVRHARGRIWSDLVTAGGFRASGAAEDRRVEEILELLHLGEQAHRPVAGLPLGTARLLEVGRALALEPTVLLLDEPSSGLDTRETEELATVFTDISRERGVSLLLVEHDVELVLGLSDTVHVIDFGVEISVGDPAHIRADPAVRAAYLGADADADEDRTKS